MNPHGAEEILSKLRAASLIKRKTAYLDILKKVILLGKRS